MATQDYLRATGHGNCRYPEAEERWTFAYLYWTLLQSVFIYDFCATYFCADYWRHFVWQQGAMSGGGVSWTREQCEAVDQTGIADRQLSIGQSVSRWSLPVTTEQRYLSVSLTSPHLTSDNWQYDWFDTHISRWRQQWYTVSRV